MARPQFSRNMAIGAFQAEDYDTVNETAAINVVSTAAHEWTISVPAGYIGNLRNAYAYIPPVTAATSGSHSLRFATRKGAQDILYTVGYEVYNLGIQYTYGGWNTTLTTFNRPQSEDGQSRMLQSLYWDADNPLIVTYTNNTNATNIGTAILYLAYLTRQVTP